MRISANVTDDFGHVTGMGGVTKNLLVATFLTLMAGTGLAMQSASNSA